MLPTLGCSSGIRTNTMSSSEAERFRTHGYTDGSVELSRPTRVGNYLVFHLVGERVNILAQNALDSVVVITDLDGNLLQDENGFPVGLFVTTRVNDGILHAGINGMWIALGQVGSTVAQGEYDKDVAQIRANAQQQVALHQQRGAIGAAKHLSRRGPEAVTTTTVDNSNQARSASENRNQPRSSVEVSSENYQKQGQGQRSTSEGSHADAHADGARAEVGDVITRQGQAQESANTNEGSRADANAKSGDSNSSSEAGSGSNSGVGDVSNRQDQGQDQDQNQGQDQDQNQQQQNQQQQGQ
ncbi:MAG: hypothetical protein WDZ82_02685 [Candidatus Paceibacterota bacterium]